MTPPPVPPPAPPAPPLYRGWQVEYHGAHLATGLGGLARVMPPEDRAATEPEIQLRVDAGRNAVVVSRALGLETPVELSVAERQQLRERLGLRWAYIDAFAWALARLKRLRAGTLAEDAPP